MAKAPTFCMCGLTVPRLMWEEDGLGLEVSRFYVSHNICQSNFLHPTYGSSHWALILVYCHWYRSLNWGGAFLKAGCSTYWSHLPNPPWKVGLRQFMPLWSETVRGLGWQVVSAYPCKQPISLPPKVTYKDEFIFCFLYILPANEVLIFTSDIVIYTF